MLPIMKKKCPPPHREKGSHKEKKVPTWEKVFLYGQKCISQIDFNEPLLLITLPSGHPYIFPSLTNGDNSHVPRSQLFVSSSTTYIAGQVHVPLKQMAELTPPHWALVSHGSTNSTGGLQEVGVSCMYPSAH